MAKTTPTNSGLENLSPEILSEVGRYMPLEDLKRMAATSKTMRCHFSRWLFHSVAIRGCRDKVINEMEALLSPLNTEMGQTMALNVKHLVLRVRDQPARDDSVNDMERQRVSKLPVLLVTMLQELKNVLHMDLQISDSLSEKEHEKLDELFSRLPIYTRLCSLEFHNKKDMNWLVDKYAKNSIKSLTLNDNPSSDLLQTAKVACPDLRRLILRQNYRKLPGHPLLADTLEAVGKEVAKAFPELEWLVIDDSEGFIQSRNTYEFKKLLGPFAHAINGMTELRRLSVPPMNGLTFRMCHGFEISARDLQRELASEIEYVSQIAPKLKQMCFLVEELQPYGVERRGRRVLDYRWKVTSIMYRGVRNTESKEMVVERIPDPSRHRFPKGLLY